MEKKVLGVIRLLKKSFKGDMMRKFARFKYDSKINGDVAAIPSNCNPDTFVGYFKLEDDVLRWRYNKESSEEFGLLVENISTFLDKLSFKINTWDDFCNHEEVERQMRNSHIEFLIDGEFKHTRLVPFDEYREMVDMLVSCYYSTVPDHYSGTIPLGDYINEIGLSSVDIYSMKNMLSHFHIESWERKCEMMTIVAFVHELEIHPLALSITPFVISQIVKHINTKPEMR